VLQAGIWSGGERETIEGNDRGGRKTYSAAAVVPEESPIAGNPEIRGHIA
jgi:hypothetical protein